MIKTKLSAGQENKDAGAPLPPLKPQSDRWRPVALVVEEITYLGRALSAWPAAMLALLLPLALALAYQTPLDWSFQLGLDNPADPLYTQSFNPPERNETLSFRWSSPESYLRFPGAGRLPRARLEIEMQPGGRPAQLNPPRVQVLVGNRVLGEVEVTPDRPGYIFDYQAEGARFNTPLIFTLRTLNPFPDRQHNLPLGVVVSRVSLRGGPDAGRPVIPSPEHYTFLLAALLVLYLGLARAGWSPPAAAGWTALPGLAAGGALAFNRFQLTPAIEALFMVTLLAYPLLALGLRTTASWLKRAGQDLPALDTRWLGLIFIAAFVVKAAGLGHPAFLVIDHWFRVHQINRFWEYPAAFWQQYFNVSTGTTVTGQEGGSAVLGQWGVQVSLPYSPLFYLFAAPLHHLWPEHNNPNLLAAVNALATWLETSQIFLLYLVLVRTFRGRWSGRAGVIAAAIWGFYPLSFLLFSDGGYNSIFAGWLTLLFVALLLERLYRSTLAAAAGGSPVSGWRGWAGYLPVTLALAAALLAHTSTLLLLSALVGVHSLTLLLSRRWRRQGWLVARIGLVGGGLATILYYGWYGPGLVGQTLPTLLERLGRGGLGQNQQLLGRDLLSGFWPQLCAHFRLWPFLLTIALTLLAGWYGYRSGGKRATLPPVWLREMIPPEAGLFTRLMAAWLVVFGLFSLIDLRANLLQKHMLFVAPLLCLGSGIALSLAWAAGANQSSQPRRRWALLWVGVVIGGLLVFNFTQGLLVWYARVYYVTYQPGSG